jgi:transposase
MIGDVSKAEAVYIVCGHTSMTKGIDSLAAHVKHVLGLDPASNTVFLFCGRKRDRLKALFWEGDGFVLLYKRLEGGHRFRWPNSPEAAKKLSWQQLRLILEGLQAEEKKALEKAGERFST